MTTENHKLWGGRFEAGLEKWVEEFGASISFDQKMAEFDLKGSIAHVIMLGETGIITKDEANQIKAGLEELASSFVGPSAVAFSHEDVVAPAKILNDFAKDADALEIKGGAIEGAVASKEEIIALASLPSREGLLSMLLSVLQAPVRNVALAVKAVADNKEDAA